MAVARAPGGSAGRVTLQVGLGVGRPALGLPAAGGGDIQLPARLPAPLPAAAGRQPGATRLSWPSGQATLPPDAALQVALTLLLSAWSGLHGDQEDAGPLAASLLHNTVFPGPSPVH
jgi:hypothetical protein